MHLFMKCEIQWRIERMREDQDLSQQFILLCWIGQRNNLVLCEGSSLIWKCAKKYLGTRQKFKVSEKAEN